MTHNLNLLSYIELVGGVFAPLLFVFLYKFAVKWLKHDTSPSNIYFYEHFNSISGKSYNILCFITNFLIRFCFRIYAKVVDFEDNFLRVN